MDETVVAHTVPLCSSASLIVGVCAEAAAAAAAHEGVVVTTLLMVALVGMAMVENR